jgi:hypothetical protein
MALPGLGKSGDDEELKPFHDRHLHERPSAISREMPAADGSLDHMERYSISESAFFECPKFDQPGVTGAKLPPALAPRIGLKFPVFDARIEAKYGVRNYIRTIARFYEEIDEGFANAIPEMMKCRDPIKAAINIVKIYNQSHVYDCQTRILNRAGRKEVYMRSIAPRACQTVVINFEGKNFEVQEKYREDILLLMQRELLIGSNRDEIMSGVQPVAFTYHAMLRLWERGNGSGKVFHLIMAEAFRRLRGVSALVELSNLMAQGTLPHYIAVPVLDGFLIASRRDTNILSDHMRWAGKRHRKVGRMLKSREDEYFIWENYFEARQLEFTSYDAWFAVTYMGANDLSSWERSLAARNFEDLIKDLDLDQVARAREWIVRPPTKSSSLGYHLNWPDAGKVMELQREMLPRPDPPDERIHVIRF